MQEQPRLQETAMAAEQTMLEGQIQDLEAWMPELKAAIAKPTNQGQSLPPQQTPQPVASASAAPTLQPQEQDADMNAIFMKVAEGSANEEEMQYAAAVRAITPPKASPKQPASQDPEGQAPAKKHASQVAQDDNQDANL